MRLWPAVRRAAYACCALGLAMVPVYYGYQALAGVDGIARTVRDRFPLTGLELNRPQTAPPRADGAPGFDRDVPLTLVAAPSTEEAPCPTLEDAYGAISEVMQGVEIEAISSALTEVQADPTGDALGGGSPLAQRLRLALGLESATPVCASILVALREAVQLAQIASAADGAGPVTGSVGAPTALSPSFRTVPPGTAGGGARGHGYCTDIRTGCVG